MEVKIFNNAHDFFHFIQWYNGELTLNIHGKAYDNNGNLIAKLIKTNSNGK